jgi:regulator of cell morphogenesis and NO signaling
MTFQEHSNLIDPTDGLPPALERDAQLIGRIVENFHVPHLRDLLVAIDLARKVEARHVDHDQAPLGLSAMLNGFFDHLSLHQAREEAVLFPMMLNGAVRLTHPIAAMAAEHQDVRRELDDLRQLTCDFEPPQEACASWRRLYELCAKFDAELREHMRLEEEVLFPRFS